MVSSLESSEDEEVTKSGRNTSTFSACSHALPPLPFPLSGGDVGDVLVEDDVEDDVDDDDVDVDGCCVLHLLVQAFKRISSAPPVKPSPPRVRL